MNQPADRILLKKHQAELSRLGTLKCRVVSDSMEPVVRTGEFVTIEKIHGTDDLRRFDILVFLQGEKFLCHYFWALNRHSGQSPIRMRSMKGVFSDDLPVRLDDVLGRVMDKKIPLSSRIRILLTNLLRNGA